jgi:hypothetical protein
MRLGRKPLTDPLSRSSLSIDARSVSGATRWRRLLAALADSILVFHRALPDLQRMKHKPDQALGDREVFLFLPSG